LKGYKACGAGNDIQEARRPIVVKDKESNVGIISCCEAQFGVARQNSGGVAEFGPWIYQSIRDLRLRVDAVIVSCHAANEDSPWPSPYIRELYKSFIDAGASVVHGHHSHVPQGYESYCDGIIFYGMGNYAVDPDKWRSYYNGLWSFSADVDFSTIPVSWQPLTFEIHEQSGTGTIVIEESNYEEQEHHRRYLNECNYPFDNHDLFNSLWHEIALRIYYHHGADYMRFYTPNKKGLNLHIRNGLSLLKRAMINGIASPSNLSQYDYLLWYHMIACESHRQMLSTALGILSGEIKDLRTKETQRLADEMMPWSINVKINIT